MPEYELTYFKRLSLCTRLFSTIFLTITDVKLWWKTGVSIPPAIMNPNGSSPLFGYEKQKDKKFGVNTLKKYDKLSQD